MYKQDYVILLCLEMNLLCTIKVAVKIMNTFNTLIFHLHKNIQIISGQLINECQKYEVNNSSRQIFNVNTFLMVDVTVISYLSQSS